MLVSFTFENYRSFIDAAHLSLVANGADKALQGALIEVDAQKGVYLLSAAAIFGPNAAGKTTVIQAIRYMRQAVRESQSDWSPSSGTRVVPHVIGKDKESTFEIVFIHSGVRYRYGFSCNQDYFLNEWLYSYPVGRERMLFARTTNKYEDGYTTDIEYGSSFKGGERMNGATRKRTRHNSLFLSALAQDNNEVAIEIYSWFSDRLRIVRLGIFSETENAGFLARMCHKSIEFKSSTLSLLRAADSNLVDIVCTEHTLPIYPVRDGQSDDEWYTENARFEIEFVTKYESGTFKLPISDQSKGVQRLVNILADLIFAFTFSETILIDEIEASLHPHIVNLLIDMYQSTSLHGGSQLIFTTHDTQLLNPGHLRRDQIWFVERSLGKSHLYPLTEFSPRKDENLERGYLRGRYGAIPALGFNPNEFHATGVERSGQS